MSLKIRKNKSPIFITLLLILALLTGLTAGYFSLTGSQKTENSKPFPEKFFKMKFPAAPLPSIIPGTSGKTGYPAKKSFSWHCPHRYEKYIPDLQPVRKKAEILPLQPPFHGKSADAGLHAPLLPHRKITGRQLSASGASWPKSWYSGSASGSSGGICLL